MQVFSGVRLGVVSSFILFAPLLSVGCWEESKKPEVSTPCSQACAPASTSDAADDADNPVLADVWSEPLSNQEALHPLVFDGPYYQAQYGDLAGMSEQQLQSHWWTVGIAEGRRASAAFDVKVYVRENADLAGGYGLTNYTGLISHYVRWGIAEGRNTANDFFVREYLELYPDLAAAYGNHFEGAALHWRDHGQPVEGRAGRVIYAPTVFNLAAYRAYNPELNHLLPIELVHHWLDHGIAEGRRSSHAFDLGFYKLENAAIVGALSNFDAVHHYYRQGRDQGLPSARDFRVKEYFARYSDLAAAYGTYYREGYEHWEHNGRPLENRLGVWQPMLHAQGQLLVDDSGEQTLLRGAAFGNNIWGNLDTRPDKHHDEQDYGRLESFGMNAVRFYLNWRLFDTGTDPNALTINTEGFAWLDDNIAWARKHGVYLVLNMHFPHGGYQSGGKGDPLWDETINQDRFVDLWVEIARRYRHEPVIAGFDLLNEPCPKASADQWKALAERSVHEIRKLDPKHLIFVERPSCVNHDWSQHDWFLLPNEANIVYEFHYYNPFEYTHQNAYWIEMPEAGDYPGERMTYAGGEWKGWMQVAPAAEEIDPGTTGWKQYDSPRFSFDAEIAAAAAATAQDQQPRAVIVRPNLMAERIGGTVYFDDLSVREYDPNGNMREVVRDDLEWLTSFEFWQQEPGGTYALVKGDAHKGDNSISITGGSGDSNLATQNHFFRPKPGHTYSVHVWMKGENIANDATGCRPYPDFPEFLQCPRALARLEYWWSPGNFEKRDKAMLARELVGNETTPGILTFGRQNNVPVFLGEFGLMHHCFERGRGGANWVNDMLDILIEQDVNFTYHAYHEQSFPIFNSNPYEELPNEADENTALTDVFKARLLGL